MATRPNSRHERRSPSLLGHGSKPVPKRSANSCGSAGMKSRGRESSSTPMVQLTKTDGLRETVHDDDRARQNSQQDPGALGEDTRSRCHRARGHGGVGNGAKYDDGL